MPLSLRYRRSLVSLCALAAVAGPALACAPVVRQTEYPALSEKSFKLERVAVAPFRLSQTAAREAQGGAGGDAADLVAAKVAEALSQSGLSVIPPDEVERALASAGVSEPTGPAIARVVADRFGSSAVLLGTVARYRERSGEAMGTTDPASVGFEVTLLRAPGGEKLWAGAFDETQHGLTDNVFNAGRYPGGGTRWLSAEEMTRWGAGEIAKTVPRER